MAIGGVVAVSDRRYRVGSRLPAVGSRLSASPDPLATGN
jgi:hypothetical protein